MDKQAIIDKAAVLLDYIATGVEKGGEFVATQAPLLAQEILAYGLAYHGVWFGVVLIILVGSVGLFIRSTWELMRGETDDWFGGVVASSIFGSVSLIFLVINLLAILKIVYAPRLYLLQIVKGLI